MRVLAFYTYVDDTYMITSFYTYVDDIYMVASFYTYVDYSQLFPALSCNTK
jgi:hypothetical protein